MAVSTDTEPARGPGRRLFLVGLLVVLAVWIDFSQFHRAQNGDSLIPVLASLDEWTFYYWGQDRFGMPVSLLAVPFRDPTVNLLVQSGVTIFCGLSVFFMLASYMAGLQSTLAVGTLSAALFLGLQPEPVSFEYLSTLSPCGVSLGAGLAGLLLLDSGLRSDARRLAVGAALLLIALWVNPGAIFVLFPLVIGRRPRSVGPGAGPLVAGGPSQDQGTAQSPPRTDAARPRRVRRTRPQQRVPAPATSSSSARSRPRSSPRPRLTASKLMQSRTLQSLALLCLAFAANLTASALYPAHFPTPRGIMPPAVWPSNWARAAANIAAWTSKAWLVSVAILALLALITVLTLRKAGATRHGLRAAGAVLGAALTYFCFMGTLVHAAANGFHARYGIMPMIFLQEGLLLLLALSLARRMDAPGRRLLNGAGLGLLIASVAVAYGPPSPARMQQGLDQALGQRTEEVIRERCTYVIGDYWSVWPTVFHANATLYRLGSKHRVWGIAGRSEITQDQWLRLAMQPTARFAMPLGPRNMETARVYHALFKLPPLVLEATLQTIAVFVPEKPATPRGSGGPP